jgi:hypothetical protein
MTNPVRSPQAKKVLAYAKDGRNAVAESRSTAHRAITIRKVKANQALRQAERMALSTGLRVEEGPEAIDPFVARTGRRSFRKFPDVSLGSYVDAKAESRPARGNSSKAKPSKLRVEAGKKGRRT